MEKLKEWFYYGLKRQENISIGKIASVGHKLPPNWKEKLKNIHGRIHTVQCPQMQSGSTVYLLGVRDANFCKTNHVPVYYESVGNCSLKKKWPPHCKNWWQGEGPFHREVLHNEKWR